MFFLQEVRGESMIRTTTGTVVAALGMTLALITPITRAGPTAEEIVGKAYAINGGDDSTSRLTFDLHKADGSERKLVYTMAWKKYPPGSDVSNKVIFFNEYPPDDKGKSYMIWVSADRQKQDDEWMYLPELRMVRKITHDQSHRHKDKEDDFARSILTQTNLVPRNPELDQHKLLHEEPLNGHNDYVVESVPKRVDKLYPYSKTRRWISKDNFLPERIDYYGENGKVELQQTFKWKNIGDAWVWEQVVAVSPSTGDKTVLDISDIRLNNHLSDEVFSSRSMRLGKDSLMQ